MPFMASPGSPDSSEPQTEERHSVLAELPHVRPQRASPRRETARRRARAAAPDPARETVAGKDRNGSSKDRSTSARAAAGAARDTKRAATKQTRSRSAGTKATAAAKAKRPSSAQAKRRGREKPAQEPTPRQGYEADSDLTGTPVSPPSGAEVVGALAELAGELAHTGIAAGGRLLRGALSRFSGS